MSESLALSVARRFDELTEQDIGTAEHDALLQGVPDAERSLLYAMRVSKCLPSLKRLETLASRWNVANSGAGGYGLQRGQTSDGWTFVSNLLATRYAQRFDDLAQTLIASALGLPGHGASSRSPKSPAAAEEELQRAIGDVRFELPGLDERAEEWFAQLRAGAISVPESGDAEGASNPQPEAPGTAHSDDSARSPTSVRVTVVADPCLNLAMQQNGIALVKDVVIENSGDAELRDVTIRFHAEPEFVDATELRVTAVPAGGRYSWPSPTLLAQRSFLAGLTERLEGSLHAEVLDGTGSLLKVQQPVAVLAYDQWGGLRSLPELLCAFVLPNHPAVAGWIRQAAALLEQWTQDPSLSGYQSKSRERVLRTAAAVFHALQTSGITYVNPPASFENDGQKIRTPDRIAEEQLATCLDLALLAVGCLEQIGLHGLVVIVEGHAFVGVWLDESAFPEPAVQDAALLSKRVELGEIAIFDPTLATNRPASTFDDAIRAARARLAEPTKFRCAIDVERSRKGGIRPLPLRARGLDLDADGPSRPAAPDRAPELTLPRPVPASTAVENPVARIERWKKRLLDLTNRNRLLNFIETKKTVPLECADLGRLEDVLADGVELTLRPELAEMRATGAGTRPVTGETVRTLVEHELAAKRLVTRLGADELERRSIEIFRAAREGLEEGGASGLYIALGFLEWYESSTSDRPRRAPLVLVPVDIQRGSIRQGFRVARAADETRFNTTLLEMLNTQHHVQIKGVDPLPEDDRGVDVIGVLQQVRAALRDVPRWQVIEEARLGFFTFAKFLMWKDLDKQSNVLLQNRLVSHLVEQPERPFDLDWREPNYDTLDDVHRTSEVYCPVLADSSQLAAVIAAADGKSFVLEGPPGTGKSQTITNVIAHCLARGKTVLFVSEKTAALNVVYDRLKRIGLERFCLELHSNKASKAEVVRRLGESLRGARERAPLEWATLATKLDEVRATLNAYARALSRVHANGLSVFRVTSLLTTLRDAKRLDLGWSDTDSVDHARLDVARRTLREAQNALRGTGDPHTHALAGVGIEDAPAGIAERIREAFARARTTGDALRDTRNGLAQSLAIDLNTATRRELRMIDAACEVALDAPESGFALIACDPAEAQRAAGDACAVGAKRDSARSQLARRFDVRMVELDLLELRARGREASESWIVGRWMKTRALRKRLLGVTNPGTTLTLPEMRAEIERALQLKDLDAQLAKALAVLSERSRSPWRGEESPWQSIEKLLAWSQRARAATLAAADNLIRGQQFIAGIAQWLEASGGPAVVRTQLESCRAAISDAVAASDAAADLLRLASDDDWRSTSEPKCLSRWHVRMDKIEPALGQLRNWALWRRLRARLIEQSLSVPVLALERGALRGEELAAAFDRSFYEAWLDQARAQDPALRDFMTLSHDQQIARFREVDERYTQLTRKVVAAKLSAEIPSAGSDAVPGSERGELNRQLELKRPKLGPRQLFQRTRSLVQKLKPCFLMSPISVAQYLPPGEMSFDLVVFDEASQIPTWDAVGAIARGRQAIIVGDSKQLPPTSFFDVVAEDEESESHQVEELESILDECRAASVPPLDLRWHYRSRHESLIAFSNRKYYENRLNTFPAAHFEGLGVQWRHVPGGVYDRGRSRTNRGEAEALVAEVVRRLRDAELARASIGIVTFSSAQQTKVEDLLDDERRKDPALDRFFIVTPEQPEAVFIKNLENVQGDERDVILFSICYGPDETGRVAMAFGPLNLQGGERRLNVAVTRARRELIVFSTLTADQIELARTKARGVADLKAFLSYAQHGLKALPPETRIAEEDDDFESPLEQEICAALRERGHTVHAQVGCSGYRIDLAVVNPDVPGRYLLGIECDGRNYHSAKTARDRDRLRQSVLTDLGWSLVRVWSSDWWETKDEQLQRLGSAIEDARQVARTKSAAASTKFASAPPPPPPVTAPPPTAPPQPAVEAEALPVYRARIPRALGTQLDFYDPGCVGKVRSELEAVVVAEGPISLALAADRVAACFDFERTRQKVVDRIDVVVRAAGIVCTEQADAKILWPNTIDPRRWKVFRTSEAGDKDARGSADLPVQEVANAAAHLLAANGACPRRDLQRALSRRFGFKALGSTVATHLDDGIDYLITDGRARLDENDRVELVT